MAPAAPRVCPVYPLVDRNGTPGQEFREHPAFHPVVVGGAGAVGIDEGNGGGICPAAVERLGDGALQPFTVRFRSGQVVGVAGGTVAEQERPGADRGAGAGVGPIPG